MAHQWQSSSLLLFSLLFLSLLQPAAVHAGGDGDTPALGPIRVLAEGRAAAVAADEGFLVVWKDHPTAFAQAMDGAGRPILSPTLLDDVNSPEVPGEIDVAASGSSFVVSWDDPSGFYDAFDRPTDLFARRFEGPAPTGQALLAASERSLSTRLDNVALREDGRFMVGWTYLSLPFLRVVGVGQAFSPSDEWLARTSPFGKILATEAGYAALLKVFFASGVGQLLDPDGAELGEAVVLSDLPTSPQDFIAWPGGGFLVVFKDIEGEAIAVQRLGEDFTLLGDALAIHPLAGVMGARLFAGAGQVIVAWSEGDLQQSVWIRTLRSDGVVGAPIQLAADVRAEDLEIAIDRHGRLLAAWSDGNTVRTRHGRIERGLGIDSFTAGQPALTLSAPLDVGSVVSSEIEGTGMLGGRRQSELELLGGVAGTASLEVTGDQLVHRQEGDTTARSTLRWRSTMPGAESHVDLTAGGTHDALRLELAAADAGARLVLEIDDGDEILDFPLKLESARVDAVFTIPFADWRGLADASRAQEVSLIVDGEAAPGLSVTVEDLRSESLLVARLAAVEPSRGVGSDVLEPGDVLEYQVEIENPADAYGAGSREVVFNHEVARGTRLLCAGEHAPQVSQGLVAGCTEQDGGRLDVDVGSLADGATATITFKTEILDSAPAVFCAQGFVGSSSSSDILTDDPATGASLDATCALASAPPEVALEQSLQILEDDGDGVPSPGDVLGWTVRATHVGGERPATGVSLNVRSDDWALVDSSAATNRGKVVLSGDGEVVFDLGTLPIGGEAEVNFAAEVGSLGAEVPAFRVAALLEGDAVWRRDLFEEPMAAAVDIEATLVDVLLDDANGDGWPSPGEILRYDVEVRNVGGRDAAGLLLGQFTFDNAELVAGSVVTSQGTVLTGNDAGDSRILVDLGQLGGLGQSAELSFEARIDEALETGAQVRVQGFCSWTGFADPQVPTDDPSTPAPGDATVTRVGPPALIFSDGFESGDANAWSAASP